MRAGEYIHDWILDLVGAATVSAFGSTVDLLFPDTIRGLLVGDQINIGYECFAPLLVKGDHWVLLHFTPEEISIYDSMRRHTDGDARLFVLELKGWFPELESARVTEVRDWPQQGYGTNDCALYVMRAIHIIQDRAEPPHVGL